MDLRKMKVRVLLAAIAVLLFFSLISSWRLMMLSHYLIGAVVGSLLTYGYMKSRSNNPNNRNDRL